jgi:hypothetical protein
MPKNYTLNESDRRLLSASLREQRSAPPRPAIIRIGDKEFESSDSWWALPPCETGLPAAILLDDGTPHPGRAVCCIYRLNPNTGNIEPVKDAKGAVLQLRVHNVFPDVINSLVRIHQNKSGEFSNEPVAVTPSQTSSTTSTTPNVNTTPAPSLCAGECIWIAGQGEGGSIVWKTPVSGGCRNTSTTTTTTTFNPSTTTPVPPSTTPAPCQSQKCRLVCLPTTTASPGTTVWPPSPAIPYRYQEVISQTYPGCEQPCTCYGVGDPCWLLNGEVESRCLVINTTTSTTTTTTGPLPNNVCDWLNGGAAGPPNPEKFVAGAWSDFRNGGWQVCNECPEGKEPWIRPEQQYANRLYGQGFRLDSDFYNYEFYDVLRQDDPGSPWEPTEGAWRFEAGCRTSPCSVGGPITATEFEAEYRALTKEDIYRYWIANACSVFGRRELSDLFFHFGGFGAPGCDRPLTPEEADVIWKTWFDESSLETTPQVSYRASWSVCKSCPPGMRPVRPPSPYIYELDENTDGELIEGVWVYKTQCVKGIDCGECPEVPTFANNTQATTFAPPSVTTTLAPCGCEPPRFCPTVVNECTRTRCVPGGSNVPPPCTTSNPNTCFDFHNQKICDCNTTTTGRPTTTSTTTASPSCLADTCEWVLAYGYSQDENGGPYVEGPNRPRLAWTATRLCGTVQGGSILGSLACQCQNAPPTTCVPIAGNAPGLPAFDCRAVGSCGATFSSPCIALVTSTTCQPSRNCPSCSNGCYWGAQIVGGLGSGLTPNTPVTYEWRRITRHRSTTESPPCNNINGPANSGVQYHWNPDGSISCNSYKMMLRPGTVDVEDRVWDFTETMFEDRGRGANFAPGGEIPVGCDNVCLDRTPNRNFNCGTGGRRFPCGCQRPSYPPSACDWMVFTPCEEVRPKECACCSTTTTTENPCSRHCIFKGDGSGGWTQISNPCSGGCPCPSPLGQSHDSCEKIELKCGSRPSTTTTTTTGTGGPTTTTTTTARPQGACCYSGYNPSGCINTWQIECTSAGGTWLGAGTNCSTSSCPVTTTVAPTTSTTTTTAGPTTTTTTTTTTAAPLGRCCYRPNSGSDAFSCRISTESECNNLFGNWAQGATCASLPCLGACCYQTQLSGTVCSDLVTQPNCVSFFSGVWYPGQSCLSLNDCQGGITTTVGPTTSSPTLAP